MLALTFDVSNGFHDSSNAIAALVVTRAGGVNWGRLAGLRPHGIAGVFVGLAASPLLGAVTGAVLIAALSRLLARARAGATRWTRRGEWLTSGALAFSHGANDAQKTMG